MVESNWVLIKDNQNCKENPQFRMFPGVLGRLMVIVYSSVPTEDQRFLILK
jgi:hypothetical protein